MRIRHIYFIFLFGTASHAWTFDEWTSPLQWSNWSVTSPNNVAGEYSSATDPFDPTASALKVSYPGGQSDVLGIGAFFDPLARSDIDERSYVRFEYHVMFDEQFDWVKVGKLPGLYGGPKACNIVKNACLTTRIMWYGEGKLGINIRTGSDMTQSVCHRDADIMISSGAKNRCNPPYSMDIGVGGLFTVNTGKWINLTQIVRLNTIGSTDGELFVWKDSVLVVKSTKFVFRHSNTLKIEGLYFNSFFGGSGVLYAPTQEQRTFWRNFSMSTLPLNWSNSNPKHSGANSMSKPLGFWVSWSLSNFIRFYSGCQKNRAFFLVSRKAVRVENTFL